MRRDSPSRALVRVLAAAGCAVALAALALTAGAAQSPGTQPAEAETEPARDGSPAAGLQPTVDPAAVEAADRLLEGVDRGRRDFEVQALFASGTEAAAEDGRVQIGIEVRVAVPPHWQQGRAVRVVLVAYPLDEDPEVFEEQVVLGDVGAAAWWVYRRTVTLSEEFLEAVVTVEDPQARLAATSSVGYATVAASQPRTETVVDVLEAPTPPARQQPRVSLVRLVAPPGGPHTGRIRLRTLLSSDAVDAVRFEVDGESVTTDDRRPFNYEIDLGAEVRSREVVAVALSASGRELGRDRILLNPEVELFDVRLTGLLEGEGGVVAAAAVTVPRDGQLERVEFYRNEDLIETLREEPFESTVSPGPLDSDDYVRVVAFLEGGEWLEDVVLANAAHAAAEVDVNLVEVYAVATDRSGEPLTDLSRSDFVVRLGGRRVEIERFERAVEVPLSLGLVLDTSGSMLALMPDAKQAGARFLDAVLQEGDQAFLVDFDTRPRLAHPMTSDIGSLLRRFGTLIPEGNTALYDAVVFSCLQFEGSRGRRALVVLTDGQAFGGQFGARESVRHALSQALPIYVIDLSGVFGGTGQSKLSLIGLTKATGGQVFTVPPVDPLKQDYDKVRENLEQAYDRIHRELRGQYVLAFSTESALSVEELEKIEVDVRRPRVKVRRVVGTTLR